MKHDGADRPVADDGGVARLSREFDFPRGSVFRMFTDPERLARWFGLPEGAEPVLVTLDPRPGGAIAIHGRDDQGRLHKTSGVVLEILEPERIVFKTATALHDGATPFEALQSVTLEELGPRRTRMNIVVKVLQLGSFPDSLESLVGGYREGWGQTLDKLQRELR